MSAFKLLRNSLIGIAILGIALVAFIKFDTPAAAEFTDNVLRPMLGANTVVGIEKIYYNSADQIQKATYSKNQANTPELNQQGMTGSIAGGKLNLTPIPITHSFTPDKNEGVWLNKPLKLFPNQEVAAVTFVRPDTDRPYAYVTLVQLDMSLMKLGIVAGKKEPGGKVGKPGPGIIPQDILDSNNLIAAFDGGFQYRDGAYGMIVGDETYLPLKKDLGTLIGYKDGSIKIIDYQGQPLNQNVEFVRQNCPILINNGSISILDEKNRKLWGRTVTTGIFTWRSGVGLTKEGNLIYAVGNNITPLSLSYALKAAGAVNAIQLDINPVWVRFNFFEALGDGKYSSTMLYKKLYDGSEQYLHGYSKDFFYVYKK